jgi:uncharacterized Zn finger protein (UPF0148 family)
MRIRTDCPKCGSSQISTERRMYGDVKCLACGHKATHADWNADPLIETLKQRVIELESRLEASNYALSRNMELIETLRSERDAARTEVDKVNLQIKDIYSRL